MEGDYRNIAAIVKNNQMDVYQKSTGSRILRLGLFEEMRCKRTCHMSK